MSKTLIYLNLLSLLLVLSGCSAPSANSGASEAAPISAKPAAVTSSKPKAASTTPAKQSGYMARPQVQEYAASLASSRNVPIEQVQELIGQAKQLTIAIRLMTPPDPSQPRPPKNWRTYRAKFVEPIRIKAGKAFMAEHSNMLELAQKRYGVPSNIIAAIIGVETLYGQHMGNYRVLDAITTLSFDYPDPNRPDRIEMFQAQLADLIELHYQGRINAISQLGSYAGAMGIPQFMPTSVKQFAVAANGSAKRVDLDTNGDDAILSVGNFLKQHGWIGGLPVFAPVQLPTKAASLVEGGLVPTLDWPALQKAGAVLDKGATAGIWSHYPLGVINLPLPEQDTVQYRTATPNFFAITQYNRSYFYASAVADLAQALSQ